ncbi:MAG: hypothetical protein KF768_04095 [Phycisphaeraceae bacterium]|nr:hypothetical protein [Phycisphaeraceae bacterium]
MRRAEGLVVSAMLLALIAAAVGGCGGSQYHVRLSNETDRTVFAGLMEVGPGVNHMWVRETLGPGARVDLEATPPKREGGPSRMSVMVGDSPNPRGRAVVRSLEEGKNRFAIKSLAPGASGAGITLEREEGGWW